jgi:glycosyltransferase involved in cell wall biosynthesis
MRRLYSLMYQLLTRVLFGLRVRDTQTGIKLVRRDVLTEVLPRMVEKRFAFDLELLAVAHRLGFRQTAELPVRIGERFSSTISPPMVWRMLQDTLATFYRLRVLRFYDAPLALPDGMDRGELRLQSGEPLRILVCNWRDLAHPLAGGAEVYTNAVAREWVLQGHSVTWFCSRVAGRPSLEIVNGVSVIRRGGRHTAYRRARQYFERQGLGRFDLIIDEVNTRPFGASAWAVGTPVVAWVHQVAREVWFHEVSWPVALLGRFWLEPRWLRSLRDLPVLTVSQSSQQSLRSYGVPNVWVVSPGQDPVEHPDVPRESVPTVVFVGRLAANKRPGDAIAAFRSVRQRLSSAQMWVVGTGPMEAALRRSAPEGVTFLGRISDAEKVERIARAHVLVATSVREGWGLNVSEAAQLGTPAIAYDVAGLRDSVTASGGLLVEPTPESLADALVEHLPEWVSNGLPQIRPDSVAPWPLVAEAMLASAKMGVASCTKQAEREARADISIVWRRVLEPIAWICDRRAWTVSGIAALIAVAPLSKAGETAWTGRLAELALFCFFVATVGALADSAAVPATDVGLGDASHLQLGLAEVEPSVDRSLIASPIAPHRRLPSWVVPMATVVVLTSAAAQSWFVGGGAVYGVPMTHAAIGTAWIGHLLSPWTWTRADFGPLQSGALVVPSAFISTVVHALGGSVVLAQRIWLTGLFAGVGAGAVSLLAAFRLRPLATIAGGLVYSFSAYIVADAGTNPVYLVALGLVPLITAWVITVARVPRIRWWLVAMIPIATLLGITAETPPLAIVCLLALASGPFLVGWLYGHRSMRVAFRRSALGFIILAIASVYWAVPYSIHLLTTSTVHVQQAVQWTGTEARASLSNGFWLNNVGDWTQSLRYPYVEWYQQFPLVFVKYLVPVAAFASLGLAGPRIAGRDVPRLRLISMMSVIALVAVFLSTGTKFPGKFVFGLLTALPYGWLLREPGRFLFLAALAYSVLIAIGVEQAIASDTVQAESPIDANSGRGHWPGTHVPWAVIAGVSVLLLPGLPLVTGSFASRAQVAASSRHILFPSQNRRPLPTAQSVGVVSKK